MMREQGRRRWDRASENQGEDQGSQQLPCFGQAIQAVLSIKTEVKNEPNLSIKKPN